jgi:penicillin-binding protein 1C
VKTGTSNDYRDAWAVGFTDRYTVGVWMGNVDRRSMKEITGSVGPGLVLRAVFAELYKTGDAEPLFLSRKLRQAPICRTSGLVPGAFCPTTMEWFRPDDVPVTHCPLHGDSEPRAAHDDVVVRIQQPSPGLHLALDPRIPDELERFELRLSKAPAGTAVEWFVDDAPWASSVAENGATLWTPTRGRHLTRARVHLPGDAEPRWTETIAFYVR